MTYNGKGDKLKLVTYNNIISLKFANSVSIMFKNKWQFLFLAYMEIVIFLTHLTELLPVSLFVELNDDVRLWSHDDCGLIVFVNIEVSVVDITILGATVVDGLVCSWLVVNVDDMVVLVLVLAKMNRQLNFWLYYKLQCLQN